MMLIWAEYAADTPKHTRTVRFCDRKLHIAAKIIRKDDMVKAHYDDNGILTFNIFDFLLEPTAIEK